MLAPDRQPPARNNDVAIIEVRDLRKVYAGRAVVDDVNFDVETGEIFGILGPNGAGKTTTVECIEGLRVPDGGTIRVEGLDPQRDGRQLRRVLGAQLQESRLPDKIKVWEALDLYSSFYDDPADWSDLLGLLGLGDKRDTRFGKLSGGQRQRLSIALALVGRPKVAVLDELTTGLDPQARRDTWELIETIRDTGVTVLLVTHFMEEAERLCDRLALLDAGRIVAIDSPTGIVERVSQEQHLRFVPSRPLDDDGLLALPQVTAVTRDGDRVTVTGTAEVVQAVSSYLAQQGVIARELRIDQPTLDDAFVRLTGRQLNEADDAQEVEA
jgi:ABC-2 type transport system ATP-binding protein